MLSEKPSQQVSQAESGIHFGWKILAAFELLTAVILLEFSIWTIDPQVRLVSGILAGCMIFRCLFCYGQRPELLEKKRLFASSSILWISAALGGLVAATFFLMDLWSPNIRILSQRTVTDWLTIKIPTVVVQQLLFQLVFIPTLLFLTGNRNLTVIGSALIFAFLHLPNPLLVMLTLSIGLFWFSQVIERPRLITLTVSHLFLAVVIANVADEYVFDMRVGQICFQKWPAKIDSENDQKKLYVYPRPLSGEVQKITQHGSNVTFRGIVFDKLRNKSPHRVFLVLGSFDPDDGIGRSWNPLWILNVEKLADSGHFELNVDSRKISGSLELRMFAQHKNGWSYPINGSARIRIENDDSCGEMVCLFPKQIRGNIGHIKKRKNRTDLIGWAFTRPYHEYIDTLLIKQGNKLIPVEIERRQRMEIANYFEDERLSNCGFISRVPFDPDSDQPDVYVRNADGELEKIQIELASNSTRVAGNSGHLR